jgi:hypothetical protein
MVKSRLTQVVEKADGRAFSSEVAELMSVDA